MLHVTQSDFHFSHLFFFLINHHVPLRGIATQVKMIFNYYKRSAAMTTEFVFLFRMFVYDFNR